LTSNALRLARRGVELGKDSNLLPWYRLSLGLAEFRNGQYAAAEQTLANAQRAFAEDREMLPITLLFHAMNLTRQNRTEHARKLLTQAAAQMPPLPHNETKPQVDGKAVSHDVLIGWMAYKEAESMLNLKQ
jgi:tetratricopeptide (TPR) repeat protein